MVSGLGAAALKSKRRGNESEWGIKAFSSLKGQVERQFYYISYLCDNGSSRNSLSSSVIEITER